MGQWQDSCIFRVLTCSVAMTKRQNFEKEEEEDQVSQSISQSVGQ